MLLCSWINSEPGRDGYHAKVFAHESVKSVVEVSRENLATRSEEVQFHSVQAEAWVVPFLEVRRTPEKPLP